MLEPVSFPLLFAGRYSTGYAINMFYRRIKEIGKREERAMDQAVVGAQRREFKNA